MLTSDAGEHLRELVGDFKLILFEVELSKSSKLLESLVFKRF
jgi:hypothetical protein